MKFDVCIIGLGYVGLTLATAFASRGLKVLGVEKRDDIVAKTNQGTPHFQEKGLEKILKKAVDEGLIVATQTIEPRTEIAGNFIITVGTPLKLNGEINLEFITEATQDILSFVTDDSLVVIRSTVKVGVSRNIIIPLLETTGKKFHLAMCPERTLEGRAIEELSKLPQVIGSEDEVAIQKAEALFTNLTNSIVKMGSYEAAEITKLVDNTYRDIRFAFANEVAKVCEQYGVNALEVIEGGKLGYERTNVAIPGLVGGPCLEKDPHIFYASASEKNINMAITKAARQTNELQPRETVAFIHREAKMRKLPDKISISLLGMAFKGIPETDDLRGSMSIKILEQLKQAFPSAEIKVYDPVIAPNVLVRAFEDCDVYAEIEDCLKNSNITIIANNHPSLANLSPDIMLDFMRDNGFIYDYWNHFSRGNLRAKNQDYFALGNI